MRTTKKYVVVGNALDTEEFKPKRVVEKRASDGMFKHLMSIINNHQRNLMLVWKATISAEIQMVNPQFGATQQIQLQDMKHVTQLMILNARTRTHLSHMMQLKLLFNHKTRGFRQQRS